MALVATMRSSISTAIDAISGLNVYDTPRDRVGTPAAVIMAPDPIERLTMGGGGWTWFWTVRLYITRTDLDSAIDDLDPYISSTGSASVIAAIDGINDYTSVTDITDIGFFELAGANHLGCNVNVRIDTSD